jgi:acyl-CoA thioesterase
MQFSDVLDTLRQEDGSCSATVSADWEQGRSVFGGMQAALLLRAMRSVAPPGVPLRTMQVTFVAPVPAGSLRL